jgi:hypothetical protein
MRWPINWWNQFAGEFSLREGVVMMPGIMPATAPRITLLLPGFRAAAAYGERMPSLETLVARGSGLQRSAEYDARAALMLWQRDLLSTLSLDTQRYPSAAISAASEFGVQDDGSWLHVEPVHLAVSIDGLALQVISTWTQAELAILEPTLKAHCEQAGFEWRRSGEQVWLRCDDVLNIETVAPQAAALHGLRGAQPQGDDAKRIVQLGTELQMLLHEHPSQQQRIARGQPPINALWLWGAGQCAPQSSAALPVLWSDERYVRGLARMCGTECRALPESLVAVSEQAARRDTIVIAQVDGAMQAEQRWFAPLHQALRSGVWRSARVYLDDLYFDIERSQLWRVWRRARELQELRL